MNAELQHVARLEKRVAELEAERKWLAAQHAALLETVEDLLDELTPFASTERLNVIVPRANLASWKELLLVLEMTLENSTEHAVFSESGWQVIYRYMSPIETRWDEFEQEGGE